MSLHDELLEILLALADVSLVASLRDDAIGFPYEDDLRVFLGDMHLISEARQVAGQYQYGLNHEDLLVAVVEQLGALRARAAKAKRKVTLYQTGDFLDLWREAPGFERSLDAASRIKDDHEDLLVALRACETRFLLGNHDFDLYRWPAYRDWQRRHYLPDAVGAPPTVMVTHGDLFDAVERYPLALKNLAAYYFSPKQQDPSFDVGQVEELVAESHGSRTYVAAVQASQQDLGELLPMGRLAIPDAYNVARADAATAAKAQYLAEARQMCSDANEAYGLKLGLAVIGHTHHARIAVSPPGVPRFTLVDCGAWIERNLSAGEPIENAQVAALCGNEVRIYQLGRLPAAPPGVIA